MLLSLDQRRDRPDSTDALLGALRTTLLDE
jgi:hypothetical protein